MFFVFLNFGFFWGGGVQQVIQFVQRCVYRSAVGATVQYSNFDVQVLII